MLTGWAVLLMLIVSDALSRLGQETTTTITMASPTIGITISNSAIMQLAG